MTSFTAADTRRPDAPHDEGVLPKGTRADIGGYPASDLVWYLFVPESQKLVRVHESKFRAAIDRTIPRNHTKVIAEIRERVTSCRVFAERHDFIAQACEPKCAWDELSGYSFAKLTEDADGGWTVHVHSNLWYRLTT